MQNEITIWRDFIDFWMRQDVPTHIIRYEDLVERPGDVIPDLMKFVFGVGSITGTQIETNIKLAVAEGAKNTYKPRVGKVNANLDKYSPEMLAHVVKNAEY